MKNGFLENLSLNSLNTLNVYDASIEILDRMKFLDRGSHNYKFKEIANQVVVETNDYYYKVYIDYGTTAKYLLEIRKKISEIYENYGIHWKILYSHCNGRVITIEQREKLKLCCYSDITCEELLKNWKKTVELLKESLKLDDILKQINEKSNITEFSKAKNILLLKQSLIKAEDYAYAPNGDVILLDDADFFILVLGENGEPISKRNFSLEVMTTCGKMLFATNKDFWEKKISGKFDLSKSYFIFDINNKHETEEKFISNNKDTINKVAELFVTGKPTNTKYNNEYYEEYKKGYSEIQNDNEKISLES